MRTNELEVGIPSLENVEQNSPPPCSPEKNMGSCEKLQAQRLNLSKYWDHSGKNVKSKEYFPSTPDLNHLETPGVRTNNHVESKKRDSDNLSAQGNKHHPQRPAPRAANPFIWQEDEDEDEKSSFSEVSEMKNQILSPDTHNRNFFKKKNSFKLNLYGSPTNDTSLNKNITPANPKNILITKVQPQKVKAQESSNLYWAAVLLGIASLILCIELLKSFSSN